MFQDDQGFIDDSILFSQMSCVKQQNEDDPELQQVYERLQQLSPVLTSMSLPQFPNNSISAIDYLNAAQNIIHSLLRLIQNDLNSRREQEEEYFRVKSDNDAQNKQIRRLKEEIEQKCKQIGQFENLNALNNREKKSQMERMQFEKDEQQKIIFKLQQKISQIQVELKKKDNELQKYKEQLKRNLNDKHSVYKNGFDISDKLLQQQKQQDENIGNNQMLQQGWESWTQIRKQLIDENFEQKESLQELGSILVQFFHQFEQCINSEYPIFKEYNVNSIYMPNQHCQFVDYIQEQLSTILNLAKKSQFDLSEITNSLNNQQQYQFSHKNIKPTLQSKNIIIFENKENNLKLKKQSNSFKSRQSDSKQESRNTHQSIQFTKQFNEPSQPSQDLSASLVSRISLTDIPTFQDSPTKNKQKIDLKKWDRVFKN